MKFVDAAVKEVKKTEPEVGLKLRFNVDGTVELLAIAEGGATWFLLKIRKEGTFYLQPSVPKELGFPLVTGGYIKTEKFQGVNPSGGGGGSCPWLVNECQDYINKSGKAL